MAAMSIARGTRDLSQVPAMTRQECLSVLLSGMDLAAELADKGYTLLAAGGYLDGAHTGDLGEHSGVYGQDLRAGDGGHTADAGLPGEHVACHDGGDAAVGLGDPLGYHNQLEPR